MDMLTVLVLIVTTMSVVMVILWSDLREKKETIRQLEESIKLWKRGVSLKRLAENMAIVSEPYKGSDATWRALSKEEELLDKRYALLIKTSEPTETAQGYGEGNFGPLVRK